MSQEGFHRADQGAITGGSIAGMSSGLATLTMRLRSHRLLVDNQLTSLPPGIFDKLTSLSAL